MDWNSLDAAVVRAIAWLGASLVALIVYRQQAERGQARFQLALLVGALCAHGGWAVIHLPRVVKFPEWIFQPGAASVLFFPLGVLFVAPSREALASLPLALAVARIGCLVSGCCYADPLHALPELAGLVLLHVLVQRHPRQAVLLVLSGFGFIRLFSLSLRSPLDPPPFLEPAWVAAAWVVAGCVLRRRIGSAEGASEWIDERTQPLLRALALMLAVWLLFPLLEYLVSDPGAALLAASVMATLLALTACRPHRPIFELRSVLLAIVGAAFGAIAALGMGGAVRLVELSSYPPGSPQPISLGVAIAVIVLAPLFEELLYRRRLLDALSGLCGPVPAVLVSSALFALAHGEPRAMLIPLVGGIASAGLVLRTGSLAPSIGAHVGWNAVAILSVT